MKQNAKPICFRFEEELIDKLKAAAKEERRSVTNLLECIIDDYLKSKAQNND